MNSETPAPGPLPTNQPLPAIESGQGAPSSNFSSARASSGVTPNTRENQGGEIKTHLKAAAIYLGIVLAICASSAFTGEVAISIAFPLYWGALGVHAIAAIIFAIKSAVTGNWSAVGRHILAVLLVAAVAAGACWLNLMALGAGGALSSI